MDAPFDVVVVGNVGIDTHICLPVDEIDFSHEANFSQNLDVIGQAGGYVSRGYARLGAKTAFIGCVGDDYSGDFIRRQFVEEGIDIQGVFVDPAGTSRSVNFMYRNGQRKNFYDGKSHMTLSAPVEQARQLFQGAKLAHFNIPNWARELLPLARQAGLSIACDIQDVVDIYDPYRMDFIKSADYLFFSAANYSDPTEIIRAYLQINPRLTIISGMGAKGCALASQSGIQFFSPVAMDLPLVDTNGAGDSLAVGFLFSRVLQGRSFEASVRRGQVLPVINALKKPLQAVRFRETC